MKTTTTVWLLALLVATVAPARPAAVHRSPRMDRIAYQLTPLLSESPRRLDVTVTFDVPDPKAPVRVQMPVWSPGDYHVQDHAVYLRNLHASDAGGRALTVSHPDSNTWEIAPDGATAVTVSYSLRETPPGFFSENVQLRAGQVFVNGPSAYVYVVGRKTEAASVTLKLPPGWKPQAPLEQTSEARENQVTFLAPDYDTLADSPVLMTPPDGQVTRDFTLEGKPLRLVFYGQKDKIANVDSFVPVFRGVAKAEARIMGAIPFQRYIYFIDVNGRGGGLEHLNACRLAFWGGAQARGTAGFVAHEFFHLWNVKRIRPFVLGPFDYISPPQTRNLWFAEGVTEYYAGVACLRAGFRSPDDMLSVWHSTIEGLQRNAHRLMTSADESSLRVWEAGNSTGFGGVNYYEKGELIGLCLDLKIRGVTGNKKSLDDVMRLLFRQHGLPKPGYPEDGIRDAVNTVAGQDLTNFYDRLARSTEEMPFEECLAYAGLDMDMKPLPNATPAQIAVRDGWLAVDKPVEAGTSQQD